MASTARDFRSRAQFGHNAPSMRHISIVELRRQFSDLLSRVAWGGEEVVVTRNGKAVAVLVSPERYAEWSGNPVEIPAATAAPVEREPAKPTRPGAIEFSADAREDLQRMPSRLRTRVLAQVDKLLEDPRPAESRSLWDGSRRLALDDYRVIYTEDPTGVRISRIGPRDNVYREL